MKKIIPPLLFVLILGSCKSTYHNPYEDKREELNDQGRRETEIEMQIEQEIMQQDQYGY